MPGLRSRVACGFVAAIWSGQSLAQSAAPVSDTELSKEIENPVTRRITLPLRYEADFLDGAYKATKDTFSTLSACIPLCRQLSHSPLRSPGPW